MVTDTPVKGKSISKNRKGHYILINGSICQENSNNFKITYLHLITYLQNIKQNLPEPQGNIHSCVRL